MDKLTDDQRSEALARLQGWDTDGDVIRKTFGFKGFGWAMEFVNSVARMAEAADHHPDIDIRYNKVTISLTTHSAGGLTTADIDLASVIDDVAAAA